MWKSPYCNAACFWKFSFTSVKVGWFTSTVDYFKRRSAKYTFYFERMWNKKLQKNDVCWRLFRWWNKSLVNLLFGFYLHMRPYLWKNTSLWNPLRIQFSYRVWRKLYNYFVELVESCKKLLWISVLCLKVMVLCCCEDLTVEIVPTSTQILSGMILLTQLSGL